MPIADLEQSQWLLDEEWDDGRAEVATYRGERVVDGAPRPHTLQLITVVEDFNRELNVKADWPYGQKPILPVVKQIQAATIPTPAGPHHFMTSTFIERDDPVNIVKLTTTSQDWSGTTMKEFNFAARVPQWTWSSYRDGEGSGRESLRGWPAGAILEEQLLLLVRTLELREGVDAGLALAPNQTTNRASRPEPVAARLRVERPSEDIRVPAGTWPANETWRITVEAADGRSMELIVAEEPPRVLLAWSVNDGRLYTLEDVKRDVSGQIR